MATDNCGILVVRGRDERVSCPVDSMASLVYVTQEKCYATSYYWILLGCCSGRLVSNCYYKILSTVFLLFSSLIPTLHNI